MKANKGEVYSLINSYGEQRTANKRIAKLALALQATFKNEMDSVALKAQSANFSITGTILTESNTNQRVA